jgi:hypothetical protein
MRRLNVAALDEALGALDLLLGHAGGFMPVEARTDAGTRLWWHRCGSEAGLLARTVRRMDERGSVEVRLRLPQVRRDAGGCSWSTVLWAVVEGSEQVERARRFRPLPSMVVQEGTGSKRILLWALDRRATWQETFDANRRLAYAFRAVQKAGDPDALSIPCPGTCLRVGRSRPVPVVVGRLTTDSYELGRVVGRLKAPPENDWRERSERGSR